MSCLSQSIAQSDPVLQELVKKIRAASSLALLILAALQLGRVVAVKIAEEVLNERGHAPSEWPRRPECGQKLESKGLASREMLTLIGGVKWWRRRGGCPHGCKIGQVIPLDEDLGLQPYQKTSLEVKLGIISMCCQSVAPLQPYQRTSLEVKWLASALAVFVSFETAAVLLGLLTGVKVCPKSIWLWVQEAGQRAIAQLGSSRKIMLPKIKWGEDR